MRPETDQAGTPWLSVIMPAWRGQDWIGASLASLASQADAGIEVIVIDSSPEPATLEIARTFSDRLNLRIFDRPDLPMWHAKTNAGTQLARAPHIAWLHQDDLWLPGRAKAARAWLQAAPGAALHLAPSAIIDRAGRALGIWRCPLPQGGDVPGELVMERLLVQNFVATPAPIYRKDAWIACGGLDESLWYTADWDIWLKLAAHGPVACHSAVTTAFRIHGGSLTMTGSRNAADFAKQMNIVLDRHLPGLGARSKNIGRAGRASISVNTALAGASAGDFGALPRAVSDVLKLGPAGIHRYFRDSRIVERVAPRLRAKLGGAF